jgi:hypothetical protein
VRKGKEMSNKLIAFRKTVGFFALASIGATAFVYGSLFIPLEYIIYTCIAGLMIFGFWLMYSVNLQKLEMDEKYKR